MEKINNNNTIFGDIIIYGLCLFIFMDFSLVCGRNISIICSFIHIILGVLLLIQKKVIFQVCKKIFFILFIVTLLTWFSPIDIALGTEKNYGIRILQVVLVNGTFKTLRDYEEKNLILNKDYFIYEKPYAFHRPRWTIVIFIKK
jgi:hypothetical protein